MAAVETVKLWKDAQGVEPLASLRNISTRGRSLKYQTSKSIWHIHPANTSWRVMQKDVRTSRRTCTSFGKDAYHCSFLEFGHVSKSNM